MPRRLLPLRVYYFVSFSAFGVYAPFFPRWLEARGVQGVSMGLVAGLLPAMSVLGPPAAGLAADALGLRGSILRVACAGACLSMAALAVLAAGGAVSFATVFAAVLAYAAFRSPMVMLADVVAVERAPAAGTTYGELRLWGSIGFLLAVTCAGRAVDPRGAVALPATVAGLLLLAFFAALPLPPKPVGARLPVGRETRALLAAPSFAVFLAVSLFAQLANASYDLCISLHLRDLGASDATTGISWAIGTSFEVVLLRFADRLVARFGAPRLLAFALFGAAGRWALLGSVRQIPVLLALQPLHAISFALWWVTSIAFIERRAPAHALAAAQGLFTAAVGVGSVAGMLGWGALYRRAGGASVFGVAAFVSLAAAILAALWSRSHPPLKTIAPPGAPG